MTIKVGVSSQAYLAVAHLPGGLHGAQVHRAGEPAIVTGRIGGREAQPDQVLGRAFLSEARADEFAVDVRGDRVVMGRFVGDDIGVLGGDGDTVPHSGYLRPVKPQELIEPPGLDRLGDVKANSVGPAPKLTTADVFPVTQR